MKNISSLLILAALLCSCEKEQPHFLPKPGGGGVEIGGVGATTSDNAAVLADNDLKTCFEAPAKEGSVTAEIDCSAGAIVAYTLVSSGMVSQNAETGAVDAIYDPISWRVSGSNDGTTWTEVDQRTNEKFIARFQDHIYYFAKAENYAHYKFEFQPNGGDKLALSDIKFHTEDPYKNWKNFVAPEITFIDLAEDKGSKLYDVLVQDKKAYLSWHAREICTLLYFQDQDERLHITKIDYFLRPMPGEVSYKGGNGSSVNINYSTDWIQKSAKESLLKLSLETRGVLFHEMVHAFQLEPKGIPAYSQGNEAWSIIEGTADAIRIVAGYHDYARRTPGGSWMGGYTTTGFFMDWLAKNKDADAIRKINASMLKLDPWHWEKAIQFTFGQDADIKTLWSEYQTALRK